jgi:hypothetical protein
MVVGVWEEVHLCHHHLPLGWTSNLLSASSVLWRKREREERENETKSTGP